MVAEVTPSNTGANAMAAVNVVTSLFSAHKSASSNRAIARHNAESLLLNRRKTELNNVRTIEGAASQAIALNADVSTDAQNQGVAGSSSALHVKSSISAQFGQELSNMNTQDLIDRGILDANQAALDEQSKANKLQQYLQGFSTVLMAGQALGLNGAALSAFSTAASAGGQAIYALAAANPVIAAALIAMAILGEDETKRIGRDIDKNFGLGAVRDNAFGVGADLITDGVKSITGRLGSVFGGGQDTREYDAWVARNEGYRAEAQQAEKERIAREKAGTSTSADTTYNGSHEL